MEEEEKKKFELDDEFRDLIPISLSEKEYAQLEENLIKEKNPEESIVLVTWNGILVDGYNVLRICEEHNIPFRILEKDFSNKEDAQLWKIDYHLGRRNLTIFVKIELALKRKDILQRQEMARQNMVIASHPHPKRVTDDAFLNSEKQPIKEIDKVNITKEIAEEIKVSTDTVSRGIQLIKKAPEAVKQKLRTGETAIDPAYKEHVRNRRKLELSKNESTDESELAESMHELKKDVRFEKIMNRFLGQMESFLKVLPELNSEQLNLTLASMQKGCALIKEECDKRKLNSEPIQPPPTILSAPSPTAPEMN